MAETETATPAVDFDEVTGHIRLHWGDEAFDLRPPTFDQMEQLEALMERAEEAKEARKVEAGEAWVEPKPMETWKENLTWWRLAFELLSSVPLPPQGQCPIWLGQVTLIIRARNHWVSFPIPALGSELLALLGAQQNGSGGE